MFDVGSARVKDIPAEMKPSASAKSKYAHWWKRNDSTIECCTVRERRDAGGEEHASVADSRNWDKRDGQIRDVGSTTTATYKPVIWLLPSKESSRLPF